ncbi:MAG: nucleotide-binding domain containing protein, partial [Stenotrophomonas sp.]
MITIVGSMSAIARQQLQHLAQQSDVRLREIAPQLLRANAQGDASALLQTVLEEMAQGHDIVISIGGDEHLNPAEGPQLAARLAQLLHQPLSQAAGLVVTGGETARAVLQELDIHTLHVHSESEPGVVLSVSESRHPQWIATKAGAFGNAQSLHRASEAIHSWM